MGDHFVSTAGGWEFVLAGAVADWTRKQGQLVNEVKWGPDQCVAVMVSPITDLLGSAARDPQFLGWSSAGMGLSVGGSQEQDLCLCISLLLRWKLEAWWLHHLSELSPPQHAGQHSQAFPAMLLELGFWESQKVWL